MKIIFESRPKWPRSRFSLTQDGFDESMAENATFWPVFHRNVIFSDVFFQMSAYFSQIQPFSTKKEKKISRTYTVKHLLEESKSTNLLSFLYTKSVSNVLTQQPKNFCFLTTWCHER